jgi:hypothetical protein
MRHVAELLFGKAAVVGLLSMLGYPRPIKIEIEIDPATGRETLLSKITRAQNRLKSDDHMREAERWRQRYEKPNAGRVPIL